jgi:membrane protein implicated in regulation of membrane protease activity
MSAFLADPPFWAWFILAVVLASIELLAPTFFFLWLGAAAAVTGIVVLVFPTLGWQSELVIFAVLAMVGVWAWRTFVRRRPRESDDPTLNRRGQQYVGRVVTLVEPIVNGVGAARVGDTIWRVAGPDVPSGRPVRVVGVRGTVLQVEPAAEGAPAAGASAGTGR